MKNEKRILALGVLGIYLFGVISFASALVVDSNYITIYPGESGKVAFELDNNDNFDIEDISFALILTDLPFSVVGSSERGIGDLNEDDDDKISFEVKASTDITPGDYNIPFTIKYTNSDTDDKIIKEGTFGLRVSAKTEIDFSGKVDQGAIVGDQGKVTLEIINKGLGDLKSVSVQIFPSGFDLLDSDKIFIGTVNSDDTDTASFDVIYTSTNPTLSAKIDYKDFDNKDQTEIVNIPLKVYTKKEALDIGLIQNSKTGFYIGIIIVLVIIWFAYKRIKKRKRKKK